MKPYTVQGNLISPQFAEPERAIVTDQPIDTGHQALFEHWWNPPSPPTHGNVIVMIDNEIIVNSVEPPSDIAG